LTYTPINLEQNDVEIVNLSWSISLQWVLCEPHYRSMRARVRIPTSR